MVEFSHEYFEDEVRDGFYVNGLMKKCWAAQIEVLSDIASVCAKYNIKWYADCGTLLGAVRHGGFIPWDDDLDICMFRDDYVRFLSVAERELKNIWHGYRIHNFHNEDFWEMISRVDNGPFVEFDGGHLDKFHGYPFRAGVDIFPLDYMSRNREEEEQRMFAAQMVFSVARRDDLMELNEEVTEYLDAIEESCNVHFDRNNQLRRQLFGLGEALFSLFGREDADNVVLMPFWLKDESHVYSFSLFEKTVLLPFESTFIQAPAAYNEVLKIEYGDYMKIVRSGSAHEYPYHEQLINNVNNELGDRSPFCKKVNLDDVVNGNKNLSDVKDDKSNVYKVVFLPYKSSKWKYMEKAWKDECNKPGAEVLVVPIAYYEKSPFGTLTQEYYDADYPEYVTVIDYNSFDLAECRPDKIYIQNPYDDDNYTFSVNPVFYSKNLKKYTNELVYIPCFTEEEIMTGDERSFKAMTQYVISPGVVYADCVIVQSEQMKDMYVKKLVDCFGEDTRDIWESKVEGTGYSMCECIKKKTVESFELPDVWKQYIYKADGTVKKVVIYYIGLYGFFEHGQAMLDKISSSLEIFKENKDDIALVLHPDPLVDATLSALDEELYAEYLNLVERFVAEGYGIFDNTDDIELILEFADAYYGDTGRYVVKCAEKKIPVMIQNVDV